MKALAPYLDRDAWWAERRTKLGSTDVGAILGRDEFTTPQQVYDRVVLGVDKDVDNADIRRGNKQEATAAAAVCEHLGLTLQQVRRHPMRTHRQHRFMVTDVDRMVTSLEQWPGQLAAMMEPQSSPGALEIKVPRVATFYRYRDEGLPLRHVLQLHHHMAVTGWKWGVFAFYTPEYDDVIAFPVIRDDEFIALTMPALAKWWEQHIVGRVRPDRPMPKPARWPTKPAGESEYREDPLWLSAAEEYMEAVALSERARMKIEVAEQQLTGLLGNADTNVAGAGVKVTRRSTSSRRQFDRDAYWAAIKHAQLEKDYDALLEINHKDDAFWYETQTNDKVEFKLTAPLPGEEADVLSEVPV